MTDTVPDPDPAPDPLLRDPRLRDVPVENGRKVLEPVILEAAIGRGGMGAVYRGRHKVFGFTVAVKCLLPPRDAQDLQQSRARFRREARITAELNHENLVRLYQYEEEFGLQYFVLEYVDGEDLAKHVARRGALPEDAAARILLLAARGLARAHRHPKVIVHRDIKPQNILLSKRGAVKVADLGLAKALGVLEAGSVLTGPNQPGTLRYMAPEQVTAGGRITPATDVWALGATLYFLLTARLAIHEETAGQIQDAIRSAPFPDPRVVQPALSDEIVSILERCTFKDPALRYQDAKELASALEVYLRERARPSRTEPLLPEKAARIEQTPARLRRGFAYLGVVAALALLAWLGLRSTPPRRPEGWRIEDRTTGTGGWARRVVEPRSGIVFRLVEPGQFRMGSLNEPGRKPDEFQHTVRITRPYYLAETETTRKQFGGVRELPEDPGASDDLPVAYVNWKQAVEFCEAIGCVLPTEAQWEYAARAGTTARYWWGETADLARGMENVFDQLARAEAIRDRGKEGGSRACFPFEDPYPMRCPVGRFAANPWGFQDMLGNVSEWCRDAYEIAYEDLPAEDPFARDGATRVVRGGSYWSTPPETRSASRGQLAPALTLPNVGFRAARELD